MDNGCAGAGRRWTGVALATRGGLRFVGCIALDVVGQWLRCALAVQGCVVCDARAGRWQL